MLKRDVIVTGDQLTVNATPSNGQRARRSIYARQRGRRGDAAQHARKRRQTHGRGFHRAASETVELDGKQVTRDIKDEKVINVATIQGVFGNRFRTTGSRIEAHDLSLLLRGGALTAPISIANEQTIGPQLGERTSQGRQRAADRHRRVVRLHDLYYHAVRHPRELRAARQRCPAHRVAVDAGTALTLPGIAGIILTVGMAVDANVLIYERIREELRNGISPQAASAPARQGVLGYR